MATDAADTTPTTAEVKATPATADVNVGPPILPEDKWSRYTTAVLVVCALAWAFDAFETTIFGIVTPALMADFGISRTEVGLIRTIAQWAGVIGIIALVPLADKWGRRALLAISVGSFSVLTGLTGFTTSVGGFTTAMSVAKVPLSAVPGLSAVMATEQAPTKRRAFAQGFYASGYPFGFLLCSFSSIWLIPAFGWRSMYFLGALPLILVFFILRYIKESPKFERMREVQARKGKTTKVGWVPVIRQYPKEVFLSCLTAACFLAPWGVWAQWVPSYLNVERHMGLPTSSLFLTIWMVFGIAGYLCVGWLMDKFGRRRIVPLFVFPAAVLLMFYGAVTSTAGLLIIGTLINGLLVGLYGAGFYYLSELFPTQVRGTGTGIYYVAALILSAPFAIIPGLTPSIGAAWPIAAAPLIIIGLLFLFVFKETIGKPLTEQVGERV